MILPVYDYAHCEVGEADPDEVTLQEEPYLWTDAGGTKVWRAEGTIRRKKCFLYWIKDQTNDGENPHHVMLDMREDWD